MGVHMANMIKSSIYGGDAAFLSNYFDHLLWSPYGIGQTIIMVALCNRADHYIFILFLSSSFFSSPNLSSRRLDVYHTSAHGVVLVYI